MNYWVCITSSAVTSVVVAAAVSAVPGTTSGALQVEIEGLRNDQGLVRIELFDDEKLYEKFDYVRHLGVRTVVVPITKGSVHAEISNLKYGSYALRFYHDEDKSGRFCTNVLGIPKVEYGFSNNARGHMGPAKYKAATFNFDHDKQTLHLTAVGSK